MPQFGKDDARVNRFASIRFDRALDEDDRSLITRAIASRDARITSWATAAERTYAIVPDAPHFETAFAGEIDATIDDPGLLVLRIRPVVIERLGMLALALAGPGRPASVRNGRVTASDIVVEVEPTGPALAWLLAVIDETLMATPGRTITPVLPVADETLASFAAVRLREPGITLSRVLETYVEPLLRTAQTS